MYSGASKRNSVNGRARNTTRRSFVAVHDPDQAERHPGQKAPVRAPEVLEVRRASRSGRARPRTASARPTGPSAPRRRTRSRSSAAGRRSPRAAGSRRRRRCRAATSADDAPANSARSRDHAGKCRQRGSGASATTVPAGSSPLAGGDQRERVGAQQRGDHVRALRPVWDRRQRRVPASRGGPGSPGRGRGFRRTGRRQRRRAARRARSAAPWSAASAGAANSANVTAADTGFPGRPNTSLRVSGSEPRRLARLERDAPEDLLDAEAPRAPA